VKTTAHYRGIPDPLPMKGPLSPSSVGFSPLNLFVIGSGKSQQLAP